MLMYHLLCLTGTGFPKLSTTTDPRTDWCGYLQSNTIPLWNVYGEMILLLDHPKSVDRFLPPLQFHLPGFLLAYMILCCYLTSPQMRSQKAHGLATSLLCSNHFLTFWRGLGVYIITSRGTAQESCWFTTLHTNSLNFGDGGGEPDGRDSYQVSH